MAGSVSLLSLNAALQDVRLFGCSVWRPLDHVDERLQALAVALLERSADVVFLQECFHRPLQDRLIAALAGAYPQVAGLARRGLKLRLGSEVLVLSKHPLDDVRFIRFETVHPEDRLFTSTGFVIAQVRLPRVGHLGLVNLHASAGGLRAGDPESPRAEAIRSHQIAQILDAVHDLGPVLLAGDLNAGPVASRACYRQVTAAGFVDAFAAAGGRGDSWDIENPLVGANGDDPLYSQRIDHVFVNQATLELLRPVAAGIVLDGARTTLPDGRRIPISDHYAVEVVFEA